MSSPSSSVQEARRALGQRLRELRKSADLTQAQLAAACGWERTKATKLESAVQQASPADLRAWCTACQAEDELADLLATLNAVESAYVEWRRLTRSGLRRVAESSAPLYERTRHLRVSHSLVIPGLFQTERYATALLSAITDFRQIPDDVEEAVTARMARQRKIRGDLRFGVVIEEAVLRYQVGEPDVMASQLAHLLDVMTLPAVALGVIPFATQDRPMWAVEGFTMFEEERVRVELLSARVTVTQPREIAVYGRAFRRLAEMAVYGNHARKLINAAIAVLD